MIELTLLSEADTKRLGSSLGACVRMGDTVLLSGEMGTGKSVLTRAAARSLGICGAVPSPTFTILNIHQGDKMKLYHFDLYRIEEEEAFYEAGLEEFLPPADGVAFVEWPDQVPSALPEDALCIELCYTGNEGGRQARISSATPKGDHLLLCLARALDLTREDLEESKP